MMASSGLRYGASRQCADCTACGVVPILAARV